MLIEISDKEIKTFLFTSEDIKNNILLENKVEEYKKDKYYNEKMKYTASYINEVLPTGIKDDKGNEIFHCTILFDKRYLQWDELEAIENKEDEKYKLVIRRSCDWNNPRNPLYDLHLKIYNKYIGNLDKCFSTDMNNGTIGAFGSITQCSGIYNDQIERIKEILNIGDSSNGEIEDTLFPLIDRVIKDGDTIRINNISEL